MRLILSLRTIGKYKILDDLLIFSLEFSMRNSKETLNRILDNAPWGSTSSPSPRGDVGKVAYSKEDDEVPSLGSKKSKKSKAKVFLLEKEISPAKKTHKKWPRVGSYHNKRKRRVFKLRRSCRPNLQRNLDKLKSSQWRS